MEDTAFFQGLMMSYGRQRRNRFNFLLQLARYIIIKDEKIDSAVQANVARLAGEENLLLNSTVGELVRRRVHSFWTDGDPRCKEEICRTVSALCSESSFPHFEIEQSLSHHGNHLQGGCMVHYFQFFTCFGFLCHGAAAWSKDEHIPKIAKAAEEVMNAHNDKYPTCCELYNAAKSLLSQSGAQC